MSAQENTPDLMLLATPANMRELANSYHVIDGLSVTIVAYSLNSGEERSGDWTDYCGHHQECPEMPVYDADGDPMYLAVRMSTEYTARLARRIGGPLS